jgi:ABC-type sugar transport system substrate-binding protein
MTAGISRRLLAAGLAMGAIVAFGGATLAQDVDGTGVKVTFIGESSSTDVIWTYRVDEMAKQAEAIGAEFTYRFAEGDYARQARMVEEEIARGANAIIAPFFDPTAANAAIASALGEGVVVYGMLGIPDLPQAELDKMGWTSTSWTDIGRKLAEVSVDLLPDGAKIMWPAEFPSGTYITDAVEGYKAVAADKGKAFNIEVVEVTSDPSTAASRIGAYLTGNADTAAIVTSGAIAIDAANTAMKSTGLAAGSPPLFGQVISPASSRGIAEGFMPKGVNIELTESSHQAVLDVVEAFVNKTAPAKRSIEVIEVTKDNMSETVPDALRE